MIRPVKIFLRMVLAHRGSTRMEQRRGGNGGQTFVSRRTRGPKSNTTEYNKANTQLKIMQWNAEGVIRKKTELEHILKKENIDICCIQETHLQKDKRFRVRGYQ